MKEKKRVIVKQSPSSTGLKCFNNLSMLIVYGFGRLQSLHAMANKPEMLTNWAHAFSSQSPEPATKCLPDVIIPDGAC